MLSRGRLAEAELLVRQIPVPVIEPSLEAVGVFRTLGDWAASQERWDQALLQFKRLNLADQVDKSEITDASAVDLLRLGPTFIAAGDAPGYRQFVDDSIARFSNISNAIASEQVIKVCLIWPPADATLPRLAPLSAVLSRSISETKPGQDQLMVAWREFALSLYNYRRGNFNDAVILLQKCLASPSYLPERTAMAHFVLAMAFYKTKQLPAAYSELDQGQELIRKNCPEAMGKISISGMTPNSTVYWYDWVIAQILQREALSVIQR
jgi:hypothetical protein